MNILEQGGPPEQTLEEGYCMNFLRDNVNLAVCAK